MRMPRRALAPTLLGLVAVGVLSWQAWAATNLELDSAVGNAGSGVFTSPAMEVHGTVGQVAPGHSTGGDLALEGGFWGGASQTPTAVGGETPGLYRHRLIGPYPNPFNPRTTIKYELGSHTRVRIDIHDVRGRLVRTLIDEDRPAGPHSVIWDGIDIRGRSVASGTYYLRLVADDYVKTGKMVLLK